ncbi:hypothetical protein V8C35DRAFT_314463 [Trichoderma chlorosporum]
MMRHSETYRLNLRDYKIQACEAPKDSTQSLGALMGSLNIIMILFNHMSQLDILRPSLVTVDEAGRLTEAMLHVYQHPNTPTIFTGDTEFSAGSPREPVIIETNRLENKEIAHLTHGLTSHAHRQRI